ncbi:MAG: glycosyltransferase 87 family protein [Propionibacteriaceae bacterium]
MTNPPLSSRQRSWVLISAWVGAKIAVLGLWLSIAPSTQNDVRYYWTSIEQALNAGPATTLLEYPTPVVALLWLPYALGGGKLPGYVAAFILIMVALDGWYSWVLYQRSKDRHAWALWWWIGFTFLMGPTAYMRFDMLPAVLAGGALLLLASGKPVRSGMAIGLGAAIKLWPALLWLAQLGRRRHRLRASIAMWLSGGMLALASLIWAGWDRLLSPLTWQKDRGLQVESVWATGPMLHRLFSPHRFSVELSPHKAFEISGPSTHAWQVAGSIATVLGLIFIVAMVIYWLRGPAAESLTLAGLIMIATIGIMIVTNKTFSPQYLMWLAAPCAALFAISEGSERTLMRRLAGLVLAICLLTQFVYPIGYDWLVRRFGVITWLVTLALAVRNIALCWLIGWISVLIIYRSRRTDDHIS